MIPPYDRPAYGITRALSGTTMDEALARTRAALAAEGFGVLTEIDLRATFQKKLGVDERPYVILGACNPKYAHQALSAEPGIGLLLPCNVVVADDGSGGVVVSAIDPVAMFGLVGRADVEPVAREVKARLERAVAAV